MATSNIPTTNLSLGLQGGLGQTVNVPTSGFNGGARVGLSQMMNTNAAPSQFVNTASNPLSLNPQQLMQGGSNGGYQPSGGFNAMQANPAQMMPQMGYQGAMQANPNLGTMQANPTQMMPQMGYQGAMQTVPQQQLNAQNTTSGNMPNYFGGQQFGGYQPSPGNMPYFGGQQSQNMPQMQNPSMPQMQNPNMPQMQNPYFGGQSQNMPQMQNPLNNAPQLNNAAPSQLIQQAPPGITPSLNVSAPATQSVEQQALGGGSNPQQVQNFMQALQGVGAGTNNTFQNNPSNNPTNTQAAPLYSNTAQQPSNASTSNNVSGYYNGGTGNMQQSSSNNWNQGGQVSGNANPNMASNANSGWQPNGGPQQQPFTYNPSAYNPNQSSNGGQQLSSAVSGAMNNTPQQMNQGGSNGGYRPQNGFQTGSPNQMYNNGQAVAGIQSQNFMNQPTGQVGQAGQGSSGSFGQNNVQSQPNMNAATNMQQMRPNASLSNATSISDKRAKTNVNNAKGDINQFLSKLGAHKYEYKNPAHGEGEFVSVMAQELEKTKLGKSAVETRPDGLKQVQYGRLSGITLAATALLHQRLGDIEKKLKIKVNK